MAQQILVEIVANGKKIAPYSSLTLEQQFNGHHRFELRFNHDVVETEHAVTIDKAGDFLGKSISITLSTLPKSGADHVFKGIVTDITMAQSLESTGDLIFSGYSPTILLDSGPHNQSFLKKTLTQIVNDRTGSVPANDLSCSVKPVKTTPLPYVAQYRESNFAFLRRLAAAYGEWFFYDGKTLNYGKPSQSPDYAMDFPGDITELKLTMRVAPVKFEQAGYLSKDDKKLHADSASQQISALDNYGKKALKASEQLFSAKANGLTLRKFEEAKELDEAVKTVKATAAGGLVGVSGKSFNPYLRPGATLQIKAGNYTKSGDVGKFIITSVSHDADDTGNYFNTFEAVSAAVEVVPNPYGEKPVAEPQLGIVTDNKDPDNLGKVKVQLLWQKDQDTTPFIRVMSPNAGTGNGNKKNRGWHFTPEIGDYVIVGFTQNDPDRPFVMGSVPHGKAIDSAPNSKNHIKAITTRSGSTVTFHDKDDDKEQEIMIKVDDKDYISILVQNGKGTIKVESSKAIEVHSAESITVQGDKTITVKSEKISVEATDSILLKANKEIKLQAADVILDGSKSFEAKGGATAKVSGAQTEVAGSASTKVKGAMLDLEASALANLKGALVKIN